MEPDPTGDNFLRPLQRARPMGAQPAAAPPRGTEEPPEAPARYVVKEDDGGPYLTSLETPEVKVRLLTGSSVTAAAARRAPEGTIYLDGAAQGEPFLDHERRVLNLDHHEGVIRRFTFAACEQAMVLVLRGLDLREKPWTIHANQPDLDTVLAIWVLLNSFHLGEDREEIRKRAVPLVRVEGLIDSQGLELLEFSGMGEAELRRTMKQLDALREAELAAAEEPLDSLLELLAMVDRMIYPAGFFEPLLPVEELALEELSSDRIVVVCRCECGIYEAEPALKRLYGKRLGLVVLEKTPGAYTVRLVDTFLRSNLEEVYRSLNLLDPAVKNRRSSNCWGGSGEIGGSPRASGTRLSPKEIAAACRRVYQPASLMQRMKAAVRAFSLGSLPIAVAWALAGAWSKRAPWAGAFGASELAVFATAAIAVALIVFAAVKARARPGLYGLRPVAAWDWLWLAPLALGAGLLGGSWTPAGPGGGSIAAFVLLPVAAELAFRGLAHGQLLSSFRMHLTGESWLPSAATLMTAVLYALWTLPFLISQFGDTIPSAFAALPGALLLGLAAGVARERSESLAAPLLLHGIALAAFHAARTWL